jgi:hypothetical protein
LQLRLVSSCRQRIESAGSQRAKNSRRKAQLGDFAAVGQLGDYPYYEIADNSTQYYTTKNGVNTYFVGVGGLAGYHGDRNPYPASACGDVVTPGNCITDAQLQTEISRIMTLNHWTSGLNKFFIVFTSTGEGSCFDSTSSSCAYTQY